MKFRKSLCGAAVLVMVLSACGANQAKTSDVQMRVQNGYIQYYNGDDWENLIATEALKGEKGDKGDPGEKGEKGDLGQNGADGKNGTNGLNGTDGKPGTDGKDGVDGKDGRDGVNGKDGLNGTAGTISITKDFWIQTRTRESYYADLWKDCGSLTVVSLENAAKYQPEDRNNLHIAMIENGRMTIQAQSSDGWEFDGWSDGLQSATRTIEYNGVYELEAYFKRTGPVLTTIEIDAPETFAVSWGRGYISVGAITTHCNGPILWSCDQTSWTSEGDIVVFEVDSPGLYVLRACNNGVEAVHTITVTYDEPPSMTTPSPTPTTSPTPTQTGRPETPTMP